MPKCTLCSKTSSVCLRCAFCLGHFCVGHRCPEDHACARRDEMIRIAKENHGKKIYGESMKTAKVEKTGI